MKKTRGGKNSRSGGFTLIELLVIITIIGILASIAAGYTEYLKGARDDITKDKIKTIASNLELLANADSGDGNVPLNMYSLADYSYQGKLPVDAKTHMGYQYAVSLSGHSDSAPELGGSEYMVCTNRPLEKQKSKIRLEDYFVGPNDAVKSGGAVPMKPKEIFLNGYFCVTNVSNVDDIGKFVDPAYADLFNTTKTANDNRFGSLSITNKCNKTILDPSKRPEFDGSSAGYLGVGGSACAIVLDPDEQKWPVNTN